MGILVFFYIINLCSSLLISSNKLRFNFFDLAKLREVSWYFNSKFVIKLYKNFVIALHCYLFRVKESLKSFKSLSFSSFAIFLFFFVLNFYIILFIWIESFLVSSKSISDRSTCSFNLFHSKFDQEGFFFES